MGAAARSRSALAEVGRRVRRCFALIGIGNSLVDVAGLTLVQRAVPDEVLARVFGVIQMLWLASVGIGAALAPVLISALGARDGAHRRPARSCRCSSLLLGPTVAKIDAAAAAPEADELRILGSVPIFAPLPGRSLEHLAGRLVPLRVDPGTVIVREGDAGDRFYIVAEGTSRSRKYGARSPSSSRAATSARSRSFETSRAPRP